MNRIQTAELGMCSLDDYVDKYSTAKLEREGGILQVSLHVDDGPVVWCERIHRELPRLFGDIAADRENRAVILTGTGDGFIPHVNMESFEDATRSPWRWDKLVWEGTKLLLNLLDIRVPVIAAINGPATTHSELALLCDIVIASDDVILQDQPHYWNGIVPGDGIAAVWQELLGPNRGRYFLLTGQQLTAQRAYELGVVGEVMPREELLPRAWELAREIAKRPRLVNHYTKYILVAELRRLLNDHTFYGLVLEGAAEVDTAASSGNGDAHLGQHERTNGFQPNMGFDRKF